MQQVLSDKPLSIAYLISVTGYTFENKNYCNGDVLNSGPLTREEAKKRCDDDEECTMISGLPCNDDKWITCKADDMSGEDGGCTWKKNQGRYIIISRNMRKYCPYKLFIWSVCLMGSQ